MDTSRILNTTRYDSEDVWNCICHLIPVSVNLDVVKIRYLLRPTRSPSRRTVWAIANWTKRRVESKLEIALLHPDKLDLPAMILLARETSDERDYAHKRIVEDLVSEIEFVFDANPTELEELPGGPDFSKRIKIIESVDPYIRKLAAYEAFKDRVLSRRETLKTRRRTLTGAYYRRDEAQRQIDDLEEKIPSLVMKLREQEEELERRTLEMLRISSRFGPNDTEDESNRVGT